MNKSRSAPAAGGVIAHRKPLKQRLIENWQLYLLLLIPVILTIVYKYGPMYGIQIAFRDFKASRGIFGSEWVGLEWFEEFFSSPNCWRMIKNTACFGASRCQSFWRWHSTSFGFIVSNDWCKPFCMRRTLFR